ncbi:hypothetical protein Tco_0757121 [Tanacetum coccineum]
MGRIDSLETELGTSKKVMGGAILTLVSRVKKLEKTVKQLRTTRLVGDVPASEGDVDIQDDVDLDGLSRMASAALGPDHTAVPSENVEEREEEEVPLRRKRSAYRRARTEFSTPAFEQFQAPLSAGPSVTADKGKAPMPDLDIPAEFLAEDAQARKRFEEEQASERLVQQLQAEDLVQEDLPNVSEERAKELDDLMLRMTETDWLNLMMQVGSNPALAKELLGADVNEGNFIERMTAIKERKKRALADLRYRALKGKPLKKSEVTQLMRNLVKNQWCAAHNGTITMKDVKAMNQKQLVEEYEYICRRLEKDRLLSAQYNLFRPKPVITEPPSKRQRVERATSQPASVPAATTHTADDPDSAGGAEDVDLDGLSRMASAALGPDHTAVPSKNVEEREEEEVPLRRKRSAYLRARTEFSTPAFEQFHAPLSAGPSVTGNRSINTIGKAPMPDLDIPAEFLAEDAQARKRFEEEHASERLVQQLQAEDLVQEDLPNVSEERAKELDDLMLRMTETDWRMTSIKERKKASLADLTVVAFGAPVSDSTVPTLAAMDSVGSHHESGVSPFADSADSSSPSNVPFESTSGGILDFFLDSDEGSSSIGDKPVEDFLSSESESDDDMDTYIPPIPYGAFKDWEIVLSCPGFEEWEGLCSVPGDKVYPISGNLLESTVQDGLRQAYECLASAPISPWLTAKKIWLPLQYGFDWKLLFFDHATSFDSAVHRVHAVSFDAAVLDTAAPVSAACGYIVSAGIYDAAGSSVLAVFINICCILFVPADYVSAGHVLVSADRDRIC